MFYIKHERERERERERKEKNVLSKQHVILRTTACGLVHNISYDIRYRSSGATTKIERYTRVHQTSQPFAKPVAKKPEASRILIWKRLVLTRPGR